MPTTTIKGKIRFTQKSRTNAVLRRMENNAITTVRDTLAEIKMWAVARAPFGWRWGIYSDKFGNSHPGWLKKSIIVIRKAKSTSGVVKVKAKYGVYVERGTRHMKAQPFLSPAARVALTTTFRPRVRTLFRA